MRFADIAIGKVFWFVSEFGVRFRYSGLEPGPWVKISPRRYRHRDHDMTCRVGSVNVAVTDAHPGQGW